MAAPTFPLLPGSATAVAALLLMAPAAVAPVPDEFAACVPALSLEGGAGSVVVTPASASVGAQSASTERVGGQTPPADLAVERLCLTADG